MIIKLKFDCYCQDVFIPDGYVTNLDELQMSFVEWMQSQPECIVRLKEKQWGYYFDEHTFLRYINQEMLNNCKEKAYLISSSLSKNKKVNTIVF